MCIPTEDKAALNDIQCRIVKAEQISSMGFVHEYHAPQIADACKPGQFLQIRVSDSFSPLLRRPFSIFKVNKTRGTISILFKVFGKGTELLSQRDQGDIVSILGPLGNCFDISQYKKVFLVGGGVGIPPLYYLLSTIDREKYKTRLFFGAASREELWYAEETVSDGIDSVFCTDDGSYGEKGFVTAPFEKELKISDEDEKACIVACGPTPMLAAVQKLSIKYSVPGQLSVESIMACGLGICMGCVLPNNHDTEFSLVCKEGPVFSEKDLILE